MDSASPLPDERLRREHKVRRRPDYQRCYRQGRRRHGPLATLHYVPNSLSHPRLGITASRKVGKAVVRQLLKRRVREIYRRWPGRSELPNADLVVHLKPAAAGAEFSTLRGELLRLFSEVDRRRRGEGSRPAGRTRNRRRRSAE
ncbi:MAG: ribonuclease P protein component [Acidobacteriota bacterium]|nr:ribonuclease P protein component [Acidobacteriota bacterium]